MNTRKPRPTSASAPTSGRAPKAGQAPAAQPRTSRRRNPTHPSLVRGCRKKKRYATETLAMDAGMQRMLTASDMPLRVYPCDHCRGFHLTSKATGSDSVAVPPVQQGANPLLLIPAEERRGGKAGKRDRQHKEARRAKAKRGRVAEQTRDGLPEPRVATQAEAAAFFDAAKNQQAKTLPTNASQTRTERRAQPRPDRT